MSLGSRPLREDVAVWDVLLRRSTGSRLPRARRFPLGYRDGRVPITSCSIEEVVKFGPSRFKSPAALSCIGQWL